MLSAKEVYKNDEFRQLERPKSSNIESAATQANTSIASYNYAHPSVAQTASF